MRHRYWLLSLPALTLAYFFVLAPQNKELDEAKKDIAHKEEVLAQLREATSRTDDLKQANQEIRASIETIEERLPSDKEMDDVLRQVSTIADESGLRIPNFRKSNKAEPSGLAMEQPIEVTITGDFDGFYEFMLALERLPRITRIPKLIVKRSDKVDGEMTADMILSIYYQGERSPL